MSAEQLRIAKRMVQSHGKLRPIVEVRGMLGPVETEKLLEQFGGETLFKRTAYAGGFTDGGLQPSPPLSRMLSNFVKNDACPEITVKTLITGQRYEALCLWDALCFEFISKRAFDALVELARGVRRFENVDVYLGFDVSSEVDAFVADSALELAAGPDAIPMRGVERMADAA